MLNPTVSPTTKNLNSNFLTGTTKPSTMTTKLADTQTTNPSTEDTTKANQGASSTTLEKEVPKDKENAKKETTKPVETQTT